MSKDDPLLLSEQLSKDLPQLSANSGKLFPELKTHQWIYDHLMDNTFEAAFDEVFETHRKDPRSALLPLTILNYAHNASCVFSDLLDSDHGQYVYSFMVGVSVRGNLSAFNQWMENLENRNMFNQLCDDYLEWSIGVPLDFGVINPGLAMSTETVARLNAQLRFQHLMEMTRALYAQEEEEIKTTLTAEDQKSLTTSSAGILMTVGTVVTSASKMEKSNFWTFLNGEADEDLLAQCDAYWVGRLRHIMPEEIRNQCLVLPPKRLNASIADNVFFDFLRTMEDAHKSAIGTDVFESTFCSPLIPLTYFSPSIKEKANGLMLMGMDNFSNKYSQTVPLFLIESLDLTGLRSAFRSHAKRVKRYIENRKPDRDLLAPSPTYN